MLVVLVGALCLTALAIGTLVVPRLFPPRTATSIPGVGRTQTSQVDGMVLVYVPAGSFQMGSTRGDRDERPVHTVFLDNFWIDRTEVTNAMYALCVAADACGPPEVPYSRYRDVYYGEAEFASYPVIFVDYFNARQYCRWAGRRLPTEAEWEKAARGPDGRTYPWGNEKLSAERLNSSDSSTRHPWADMSIDDGHADTAPVGN